MLDISSENGERLDKLLRARRGPLVAGGLPLYSPTENFGGKTHQIPVEDYMYISYVSLVVAAVAVRFYMFYMSMYNGGERGGLLILYAG